jgi:hypothetical protein
LSDYIVCFVPLCRREAGGKRFLRTESGEYDLFHRNGEFPVDVGVLGEVTDFGRFSLVLNLPSGQFVQTQQAFDERSLSASVGADDTQKVLPVNGQVYVVQYGMSVVGGTEIVNFKEYVLRHVSDE